MPRLTRLNSFLDRFEQRLEVDCERLKRQLLAQVDQQFGVLRSKVTELRSRFGGNRVGTINIDPWIDDPPVETVPVDQCIREQHADLVNQPSTSTGHKRKSPNTSRSLNANKRPKTVTTDGSSQHQCKSPGCDKSFPSDSHLAKHERIHLNIKAFSCTWPGCSYSAVQKGDVVKHVREQHFKIPRRKKGRARLNIVDNRNPKDFVRVDNQLLERRLV